MLAQPSDRAPCVSLYLPTSPRPDEAHENDIRLKNLMREAEEQLRALDHDSRTATALLERIAEAWSQHAGKRTLRNGLGLFVDGRDARSVTLNYSVDEFAFVGERF